MKHPYTARAAVGADLLGTLSFMMSLNEDDVRGHCSFVHD